MGVWTFQLRGEIARHVPPHSSLLEITKHGVNKLKLQARCQKCELSPHFVPPGKFPPPNKNFFTPSRKLDHLHVTTFLEAENLPLGRPPLLLLTPPVGGTCRIFSCSTCCMTAQIDRFWSPHQQSSQPGTQEASQGFVYSAANGIHGKRCNQCGRCLADARDPEGPLPRTTESGAKGQPEYRGPGPARNWTHQSMQF